MLKTLPSQLANSLSSYHTTCWLLAALNTCRHPYGTNLGANYYFSIEWVDRVSGTLTSLGNVTADNQGTISTTITAPANLVSGRGYRIVLTGGLVAAQATFVAQ